MVRALAILFSWLLVVGFLTIGAPRVTPPGGLLASDYVLMCSLPLGAYVAGKRWYNSSVFLLYGAFGTLTFAPGFFGDGHQGLKYVSGYSNPFVDVTVWTLVGLLVAIICSRTGKAAYDLNQ